LLLIKKRKKGFLEGGCEKKEEGKVALRLPRGKAATSTSEKKRRERVDPLLLLKKGKRKKKRRLS